MTYSYLENSNVFVDRRILQSKDCVGSDVNCDSLDELLEKYEDWPTLKEFYETKETLLETLEANNTITNDEASRIEAAYNQGEPSNQLIIC